MTAFRLDDAPMEGHREAGHAKRLPLQSPPWKREEGLPRDQCKIICQSRRQASAIPVGSHHRWAPRFTQEGEDLCDLATSVYGKRLSVPRARSGEQPRFPKGGLRCGTYTPFPSCEECFNGVEIDVSHVTGSGSCVRCSDRLTPASRIRVIESIEILRPRFVFVTQREPAEGASDSFFCLVIALA